MATLSPLVVRYASRMRPNRVYPVTVTWKSANKKSSLPEEDDPYIVRLVMAGAQVVPSERTLDPTDAKDKAVFFVTPLAKGWLRGERLEVLYQREKVQEISLPAKVITQRFTWFLFWLMILIPLGLIWLQQIEILNADALGGQFIEAINKNVPPAPDMVAEKFDYDAAEGGRGNYLDDWNSQTKDFFRYLLDLIHNSVHVYDYIPFYTFLGVFVLMILSCIWHRTKRRKRVGKPVPVID